MEEEEQDLPPCCVFVTARVPRDIQGDEEKLKFLIRSLEEYVVAASRWLARPTDRIASLLWEEVQLEVQLAPGSPPTESQVWSKLFPPGGGDITVENFAP